ncbi:MAG: hypothetical protein ACI841_005138, partial [Planctomycetota bacterium]
FREHASYRRLDNSLNLDCIQNNLSLRDLQRLERSPELIDAVLGIHAVEMPADELLLWVQGARVAEE